MTTAKSVAVFAIIFGCFAVLYPKIFHPMVLHVLGLNQQKAATAAGTAADDIQSRLPQHLRQGGPPVKSHPVRDDVPGHMRGGPHPGLRAAAEMRKQAAAQQGSSGKGMMGVVLPMYAVGIVIYLIYTMTKVFGRKEKSENGGNSDYIGNHFSDIRYNADKQKFVVGNNDEEIQRRKIINQQKDLEKLLLKADREDISDVELLELKRRLLETEAQMARILEAMEAVQQKVGSTVAAAASEVLVKGVDHSADVDDDPHEVDGYDLSRAADDCNEGEAEFFEDINGGIDGSVNSEDEDETDEDMIDEKILTGDMNLRNYTNLAEELKDFVTESSEVWKDNCENGGVCTKDNASGDLRQRILDKQQIE